MQASEGVGVRVRVRVSVSVSVRVRAFLCSHSRRIDLSLNCRKCELACVPVFTRVFSDV